ncbi:ubiquitin-like protein Pup [Actinomyces wuliandei]|uniref:ubiquitin-like protein Pup n=1 Tax=Actinomyces wuliandei TaxID=2057743 RepID=UPI000FDB1363|nr:ubiquitin-like protein Pup [Actinomyces wuliandei]
MTPSHTVYQQAEAAEVPGDPGAQAGLSSVGPQAQVAGVDEILDEIDSVIETNAAAFVQGFVQKGGQ